MNSNDPMRGLREEFDRELASLRAPGASQKLREIFAADPHDIADAANAASDDDRDPARLRKLHR